MDVAAKLQLKPGMAVAVLDAPAGFDAPLPEGGSLSSDVRAADATLAFARDRDGLDGLTPVLQESARAERLTWIAYPKAGQLETDLNRDILWKHLEKLGIQGVRQIAIDDVWSALRFRPKS